VLLYEMVTGHLPYDLSKARLPDAVRIICEETPKPPATTFTGTKRLDVDVATIAGKCLEKEPARRYQSVAALGEDVQRYLNDQPILARPPSAAYQFRKLVIRHKAPFAAAAGAFVLLLAFSIAMTVQAARIAKERDRASSEAETARRVSDFMEQIFRASDPWVTRPEEVSVRRMLDEGAERVERELRGSPAVQARLMRTMAIAYRGVGMPERSEPILRRAVALSEEAYGPESLEMADVLNELGGPATAARAHDIRSRLLPPDDPRMARSWYFLGKEQLFSNDPRGEASLRKALEMVELSTTPDEQLQIWILNELANAKSFSGDLAGGVSLARRALVIRERYYRPDHPDRVSGLALLGYALLLAGERDEARRVLESGLAQAERALGRDHVGWANMAQSLGELHRIEGRYGDARDLLQRALSVYENLIRKTGSLHDVGLPWGVVDICTSLGLIEEAEGHLDEAIRLLGRSREVYLDGRWPATQDPSAHYARVLRKAGRIAEAERIDSSDRGPKAQPTQQSQSTRSAALGER
jgi:tetratricopeptide (TPR) repeat protein